MAMADITTEVVKKPKVSHPWHRGHSIQVHCEVYYVYMLPETSDVIYIMVMTNIIGTRCWRGLAYNQEEEDSTMRAAELSMK